MHKTIYLVLSGIFMFLGANWLFDQVSLASAIALSLVVFLFLVFLLYLYREKKTTLGIKFKAVLDGLIAGFILSLVKSLVVFVVSLLVS